jgi:hypothetical protein
MNQIMQQNATYSSIMNYQIPMQPRAIDQTNPIQFAFQQPQNQRILYPYFFNTNIVKQTPQIQNIPNINTTNQINTNLNIISNPAQENSSTKNESVNENSAPANSPPMKLLTKYKDIYVPSIYLLDYDDATKPPFNVLIQAQAQNQTHTYNQLTGQVINNNQNNSTLSKYLNYGYNFEQWKVYVKDIRKKLDELNELVKSGKIRLPDPENELEYLFAFPSDFGGLGNVQNDQNYENVKFYDPKDTTKIQANKNFMSLIKFEHDQTWFPLENNLPPLNKQINDYNKIINTSYNPYLKYYYPQNFLIRNPNNIPSTIISTSEQDKTNGNNSTKNESKKDKER